MFISLLLAIRGVDASEIAVVRAPLAVMRGEPS
jgi:hypothetical protein